VFNPELVPLADDYDNARDLPMIQGVSWNGSAGCDCCGADLRVVGYMDNCVVLECPSCRFECKALEGGSHPERFRS
jgi:hypothetical protein